MSDESTADLLQLFDETLWFNDHGHRRDLNIVPDVASYLSRVEMRGIDVGDRWQQVEPYLQTAALSSDQPFIQYHAVYAVARANPSFNFERVFADIRIRAASVTGFGNESYLFANVLIDVLKALIAHAKRDYVEAEQRLKTILQENHFRLLGGSAPQRNWLNQLHEHARAHSQ